MSRQPLRRSGLFLMELIVAILFFSLAATVCVRLFVKSHTLEKESVNLNHAVNASTSAAEIFRSQEDFYPCLKEQFPQGELSEGSFRFYYDKDWKLCRNSEKSYTITISTKENEDFLLATITAAAGQDSIYELSVKKYIRRGDFS